MSEERTLYLDPWSGVSGDMVLAALLDTDGPDGRLRRVFEETVEALRLPGAAVEVTRDVEWGIGCTRVRVAEGDSPPLRHLAEMEQVIDRAGIPDEVRAQAVGAVRRLAAVEAEIHRCSVDDIHFHEVGAVDTLIDVVGAFSLLHALAPGRVVVGTIPVGGGTVEIAHGRMGVPAPATVRLLEGYEVVGGPEPRELTTPTGALIVSQLRAEQGPVPSLTMAKVGYGAGTMKLDGGPNILRVILGVEKERTTLGGGEVVVELQTNLDDVSPEVIAYASLQLRDMGALDVWTTPAVMKKARAAVVLHALVPGDLERRAAGVIFEQTGTLGVRRQLVSRYVAERGTVQVEVYGSPVRVKWGRWGGRLTSAAAEYDDAAAVAGAAGRPLIEVMEAAVAAARAVLPG